MLSAAISSDRFFYCKRGYAPPPTPTGRRQMALEGMFSPASTGGAHGRRMGGSPRRRPAWRPPISPSACPSDPRLLSCCHVGPLRYATAARLAPAPRCWLVPVCAQLARVRLLRGGAVCALLAVAVEHVAGHSARARSCGGAGLAAGCPCAAVCARGALRVVFVCAGGAPSLTLWLHPWKHTTPHRRGSRGVAHGVGLL